MQFADFVTCGFNQIVNNLAKIHYRWGQNADVVVRMPTGAGTAAGPFHSQSNEAWFFHTTGLKIVFPSNPYDAARQVRPVEPSDRDHADRTTIRVVDSRGFHPREVP